jgi:hypothetical protein
MQRLIETERIAHTCHGNAGRAAKIAQHLSYELIEFAFIDSTLHGWHGTPPPFPEQLVTHAIPGTLANSMAPEISCAGCRVPGPVIIIHICSRASNKKRGRRSLKHEWSLKLAPLANRRALLAVDQPPACPASSWPCWRYSSDPTSGPSSKT